MHLAHCWYPRQPRNSISLTRPHCHRTFETKPCWHYLDLPAIANVCVLHCGSRAVLPVYVRMSGSAAAEVLGGGISTSLLSSEMVGFPCLAVSTVSPVVCLSVVLAQTFCFQTVDVFVSLLLSAVFPVR